MTLSPEGGQPMLGQVWFVAEVAAEPCALIATWPISEANQHGIAEARVHTSTTLCPLSDILGAVSFRNTRGHVRAIVPKAHRWGLH